MESTVDKCDVNKAQEKLWPLTTMWTIKDVADFLADIGYGIYSDCFRRNAISGKDLPNLTVFDLQRLGVDNLEDAICVHSALKKMAAKLLPNPENPGQAPNISYPPIKKKYHRVPVLSMTNPNYCACQVPRLPPLPDYEMTVKPCDKVVPYRDPGDRIYRYNLGCQSYHDHCMVMGRKDAWMMYNSKF